MAKTDMDRELKKGSTELLILSLLEGRARHGYDIGRRSSSAARAWSSSTSLPSIRCSIGWSGGAGWPGAGWSAPGERRRRYYRLTSAGRSVLADQKDTWRAFVAAVNRVVRTANA